MHVIQKRSVFNNLGVFTFIDKTNIGSNQFKIHATGRTGRKRRRKLYPTGIKFLIALDLLLFLLAGAVAAQSAREGSEYFVPVLLVVSLVAFAGTVLVARFIEWRDAQ